LEDITEKILMREQMRKSEERVRMMLDATPMGCELWDSNFNIIDCNEETVRLFGVDSKQVIIDGIFDFSPEYQSDGQRSVEKAAMYVKKAFAEGRCEFEWTHRLPDGTLIPAEVKLVRLEYGENHVVAAYTRDLREHNRMMEEIHRRDRLLHSVNQATAILFAANEDDFELSALTKNSLRST